MSFCDVKTPETLLYDDDRDEDDFTESQMPDDSDRTPSEGDDDCSAEKEMPSKRISDYDGEVRKLFQKAIAVVSKEDEVIEKMRSDVCELTLPAAMDRLAKLVLRSPRLQFDQQAEMLEVQALVELYVTHNHFHGRSNHKGEFKRAIISEELKRRSILRCQKRCSLDEFGYIVNADSPGFERFVVPYVVDTGLGDYDSSYVEGVWVRFNPVLTPELLKKRPIYPPTVTEDEAAKVTVECVLSTFLKEIEEVTPPGSLVRFLARCQPLTAIVNLVRATHIQPNLSEMFACLGNRDLVEVVESIEEKKNLEGGVLDVDERDCVVADQTPHFLALVVDYLGGYTETG